VKFDEFWHQVLSLLQTHDGFVESAQLESDLHIQMQEIYQQRPNYKAALTDVPNRLRVEWDLHPDGSESAHGTGPNGPALSMVRIYFYNATFEAFDLEAANRLVRKTLAGAGFVESPQRNPHGGFSGARYVKLRSGRLPYVEISIEPNNRWPDGLYSIGFAGVGETRP